MPSYPAIFDVEWLNSNSQRRYPLHDDATTRDISDSVSLPSDFIVDLIVPVHVDNTINPEKFHIHTVAVFGTGVTVTLGYDGTAIGDVSIDSSTFTTNSSYNIQGTGDFFDTVAKIVIGSLSNISNIAGSYEFDLDGARLSPTTVKPDIRGVNALYIQNGSDRSEAIQGDVVLQAGRNMFITFVSAAGTEEDPHKIVLNAINGQGLNTACGCGDAQDLPCIKTINGIMPDNISGNFSLLDSECIQLETISNGLRVNDSCSKPCCGCDELTVVKTTLEQVVHQINSLEGLASRLEAATAQLQFNLLSSDPWSKG